MRYPDPEIGSRYGRLVVLSQVVGEKPRRYLCQCDCGATSSVKRIYLVAGRTKSCGCYQAEHRASGDNARKHGRHGTREWKSWVEAKNRCSNPNADNYKHYGGRGIKMCDEWANDFAAFYAHLGPRPKGHELDRIDNDKGYEPGNVRWATHSQNVMNRRNTIRFEYMGRMVTIDEYAVAEGINYKAAYKRYRDYQHLIRGEGRKMRTGLSNGNAKLSDEQVREIRSSNEPNRALSDAYGVSISLIQGIKRGDLRKSAL